MADTHSHPHSTTRDARLRHGSCLRRPRHRRDRTAALLGTIVRLTNRHYESEKPAAAAAVTEAGWEWPRREWRVARQLTCHHHSLMREVSQKFLRIVEEVARQHDVIELLEAALDSIGTRSQL